MRARNRGRRDVKMDRGLGAVLAMAVGGFLAAGCGGNTITVTGVEVYESQWNRTVSELAPTAAFDLSCDQGQLQYSLLRREGRHPVDVGVEGCGERRRYSRVGTTWFSATQAAEAGAEQQRLDAEAAAAAAANQRQQQQQQQQRQQTYTAPRSY